ncbi:LOW QUALITY PROTEIN: replication factor C subunit 1 [Pterocles gutturalis]
MAATPGGSDTNQDIRKFFGVVPSGKRQECGYEKSEKIKNGEGPSSGKKRGKEAKVNNSPSEDDSKQKRTNKKRRIIYDSDSEEELQSVKKSQKPSEKKTTTSKLGKVLKQDPVVYISETDEDDDFVNKSISLKPKENGTSVIGCPGTTAVKKDVKPQAKSKPLSPVKQTLTSALDYFGTSSVQRSEKKLVASKRKELSQSRDSTVDDEAIARQLQLEEDSELERQLHEDEEFAKTLAMLDETPQKKKARKDSGGEQTILSIKSSPNITERYKQSERVKATNSTGEGKNYTAKQQTKSEHSKGSHLSPQSSDGKIARELTDKTLPLKPSSKLLSLKQKEEIAEKERGAQSLVSKEKTISGKEEKTTPKKEKISPKKIESVSPEDSEKKRINYQAYRSFLNREGPKALGSKEIPQGAENCLEGLTFVITGVLECIERDEAKSLIERYGGKVTGNVSKKTNYLVMGRDCGQSKCEKASALGTKVIDEDGLFDLIRTMPGKKSKYELAAETEAKKAESRQKTPQKAEAGKRNPLQRDTDNKKKSTPEKGDPAKFVKKETTAVRSFGLKWQAVEEKEVPKPRGLVSEINDDGTERLLWVDKYKPASLKAIIGQQGEQSCANKLLRWLRNWHKNTSEDGQAKTNKPGGKDDGTGFKAALLSGPPGVGKTTTASLVCKELGYSYVELNASDTRSKNSLKEVVAESLNNTSIKDFCSVCTSSSVSGKHVLIMDEVDGMAGNEDRGGIQELIGLIRHTKIPIICMCNDRNHPKIRSLVLLFDLRFQRPRLEQIKGAMMYIAFKEGLKIPPPAMQEIILAANQDIRQVLHNLNMWCAKDKSLTFEETDASRAKKDIKLVRPFDVVRKVFATGEEASRMSLIDKSDFFHDFLAPLFVQENYVHVKPAAAGGNLKKHLVLLSRAADSICDGDIVDKQIRSKQNWNLLPTQAIYASVLPGELMRGYMSQFPVFPSWLGKSSTGKHDRIIQELAMHMSLRTQTCKRTVNMEYLPYLRDALVQPLKDLGADGIEEAIAFMDSYCLMKEDIENIMEISTWGEPSPFSKLDPKVKAAFTRAYNKEAHLTPYSLTAVKTNKRQSGSAVIELNEDLNVEEMQSDEDEQDTVESDAMIKQKKVKSSKLPKREKNEETTKKEERKEKTRH